MRSMFPCYYPLTKKQFDELWKECLFVPDANVLLDLYRYTADTQKELIDIFDKISDRLWVPHQIALEYLRRRPHVIASQATIYQKAKGVVLTLTDTAKKEIEKHFNFRSHPFLDKEAFLENIESALSKINKELDEQEEKHPDLLRNDYILEKASTLFEGKVGSPYSAEKLKEICNEGKLRYSNKVPPGYKDATGPNKKEGNAKYGDLILWYQIIDKAKELGKPIIFITNDGKEDWWWISKGETLGCRPELIEEMQKKASVFFHLYNSERFISYAKDYLEVTIKEESINEVRDVRMYDESIQRAIDALGYRSDIENAIKNATLGAGMSKAAIDALGYRSNIENAIKNATLGAGMSKAAIDALGYRSNIENAIKNATLGASALQAVIDAIDHRPDIERDTWAVTEARQADEVAHPTSDVLKSGEDSAEELPEDKEVNKNKKDS